MADLKHTPGPWKASESMTDKDGNVVYEVSAETPQGHLSVAWVIAGGNPTLAEDQSAQADARFIAAAPALLAALRALLSAAERMVDKAPVMGRTEAEAMDRARLAIRRATGEGT